MKFKRSQRKMQVNILDKPRDQVEIRIRANGVPLDIHEKISNP